MADPNDILLQFREAGIGDIADKMEGLFKALNDGTEESKKQIAALVAQLEALLALWKAGGEAGKLAVADFRAQLKTPDEKREDRQEEREAKKREHEEVAEHVKEKGGAGIVSTVGAAKEAAEALGNLSFEAALRAIEELNEALKETIEIFGKFGAAVGEAVGFLGKISLGIAGVGFAIFEFANISAEAVVKVNEFASAAGTSMQEMMALQSVFAEAGAKTDNFAMSLANLNMRLANEWPETVRGLRDAARVIEESQIAMRNAAMAATGANDLVIRSALSVSEAQARIVFANKKVEDSYNKEKEEALNYASAQDAVKHAAWDVESAEMNLARTREKYRNWVSTGSATVDPQREEARKRREMARSVEEAEQALKEQRQKAEQANLALSTAEINLGNAQKQSELNAIAATKAQLDLNEAKRQAATADDRAKTLRLQAVAAENAYTDALLKSAPLIADQLGHTGAAFSDVKLEIDGVIQKLDLSKVSVQDLSRGIELIAGRMSAARQGLGADQIATPTALDTLKAMSLAMKNLGDNTQRLAVQRQFMGRFWQQAQAEALEKLIEKLEHAMHAEKGFNDALTATGPTMNKMVASVLMIEETLEKLRNLMAAPFAEIFSEELLSLNQYLLENYQSLEDWAKGIATKIKPIIQDFFRLLKGEDIQTEWLQQLIKFFGDLGGILGAIGTVLGNTFSVINDFVTSTVGWEKALSALVIVKLGAWLGELAVGLGLLEAAGIVGIAASLGATAVAIVAIVAALKLYDNYKKDVKSPNPEQRELSKQIKEAEGRRDQYTPGSPEYQKIEYDEVKPLQHKKLKLAGPADEKQAKEWADIEAKAIAAELEKSGKKKEAAKPPKADDHPEATTPAHAKSADDGHGKQGEEKSDVDKVVEALKEAGTPKSDGSHGVPGGALAPAASSLQTAGTELQKAAKDLSLAGKGGGSGAGTGAGTGTGTGAGLGSSAGVAGAVVGGGTAGAKLPSGGETPGGDVRSGVVAPQYKPAADGLPVGGAAQRAKMSGEDYDRTTAGPAAHMAMKERQGKKGGYTSPSGPDAEEMLKSAYGIKASDIINPMVNGAPATGSQLDQFPRSNLQTSGSHLEKELFGYTGKGKPKGWKPQKAIGAQNNYTFLQDAMDKGQRVRLNAKGKYEIVPETERPPPLALQPGTAPDPEESEIEGFTTTPGSILSPNDRTLSIKKKKKPEIDTGSGVPHGEAGTGLRPSENIEDRRREFDYGDRVPPLTNAPPMKKGPKYENWWLNQLFGGEELVPGESYETGDSFADGGLVRGFAIGGLVGFASGGSARKKKKKKKWGQSSFSTAGDFSGDNFPSMTFRFGEVNPDFETPGFETPGFETPGFRAFGGLISGPGTTTSDSIPAMLSDKEYVVKADAVQHYGVDMFDAINTKKFADGGAVGGGMVGGIGGGGLFAGIIQTIRALANSQLGNAVSPSMFMGSSLGDTASQMAAMVNPKSFGGHRLDLTTDQGAFSALVSDQTLQSLQRSALSSKMTTTGTKPSWYT